jgi:hypothetical protein
MCMKCGTRTGGRGGCTCRKDRTNKCIESGKHFDYIIDKEPLIEQGVLFWGNVQKRFTPLDKWRERIYHRHETEAIFKNLKR